MFSIGSDEKGEFVAIRQTFRISTNPTKTRAKGIYEKAAKERQSALNGKTQLMENLPQAKKSTARDAAGKAFGVSGKSVDYAAKVIANAVGVQQDSLKDSLRDFGNIAVFPKTHQNAANHENTTRRQNNLTTGSQPRRLWIRLAVVWALQP